jgi:hypothetical protein
MPDWLKGAIGGVLAAAVGGGLALVAAVATGCFSFASKDEELRVHLVEIAMGILRADPTKEDVAGARGWAMDAIDKYSGLRPFTAAERDALTHKPIGGAAPPADSLERKSLFEGYGKDGFVIIPPRELPDGSVIVPPGFGKDWFVVPKDGSGIISKKLEKELGKDGVDVPPKAPLHRDAIEPLPK